MSILQCEWFNNEPVSENNNDITDQEKWTQIMDSFKNATDQFVEVFTETTQQICEFESKIDRLNDLINK